MGEGTEWLYVLDALGYVFEDFSGSLVAFLLHRIEHLFQGVLVQVQLFFPTSLQIILYCCNLV